MIKRHYFDLAGVSHYEDALCSLSMLNDDYNMSKRELAEMYGVGDKVFKYISNVSKVELVPEPDNEHDPNAIRVDADGQKIGYIKAKETQAVRDLMASPLYRDVAVDEICLGEYKDIDEDDDGKIVISKEEQGFPTVTIVINENIDCQNDNSDSENENLPKKGRSALGVLVMVLGIIFALLGLMLAFGSALGDGLPLIIIGSGLAFLSGFMRKK